MSIFLEAIQRLIAPPIITNPKLILVVGTAGLLSNIAGLFLFHEHGHSHGGGDGHDEEAIQSHSHSHTQGSSQPEGYQSLEESDLVSSLPENIVQEVLDERSRLLSSADLGHRRAPSATHAEHYHNKPRKISKTKSMNMEGVFLHVLGDALGNIGVMLTAIFIWKTDYSWKYYMDPVISLVITFIIFSSAMPLCRRASTVLLQGTPQSVDADEVRDDVASLPGVIEIHDLHIWILKEDLFIATLHVSVSIDVKDFMALSRRIQECLHGHGIYSATIQPEFVSGRSSHASSISLNNVPTPVNDENESPPSCVQLGNKSVGGLRSVGSSIGLS